MPRDDVPPGSAHFVARRLKTRSLEFQRAHPKTLDLSNAQVENWKFRGFEKKRDYGSHFRDLLERHKAFRPRVYQEIEAWLYSEGSEEAAKDIRVSFVRRLRLQRVRKAREEMHTKKGEDSGDTETVESSATKTAKLVAAHAARAFNALNLLLTRNFTSTLRPFLYWVILYAASIVFFVDTRHLDISSSHKRAFIESAVIRRDVCKTLEGWHVADSALFSARFAIPLLNAIAYDEIDVADKIGDGPPCPTALPAGESVLPRWLRKVCDCWRPSVFAPVVRAAAYLLLGLLTATLTTKVSRTPKG